MINFGISYSERAQLKIYNRVVASSFSLPEAQRTVLLFILQRTVGWQKAWEAISLKEYEQGVFKRKRARGRTVVIGGTGLSHDQLNRAIEGLCEIGAIKMQLVGNHTFYRIDEYWCHPELQWLAMWELRESEYIYDENTYDCE